MWEFSESERSEARRVETCPPPPPPPLFNKNASQENKAKDGCRHVSQPDVLADRLANAHKGRDVRPQPSLGPPFDTASLWDRFDPVGTPTEYNAVLESGGLSKCFTARHRGLQRERTVDLVVQYRSLTSLRGCTCVHSGFRLLLVFCYRSDQGSAILLADCHDIYCRGDIGTSL